MVGSGSRTRKDWLRDEMDFLKDMDSFEERIERMLRVEDELIWAWYRDPETNLTQTEARDRAQEAGGGFGRDYGRFNISQSSLSRKLKKLDDEVLTEPVRIVNIGTLSMEDHDGGLLDLAGFDHRVKAVPESLDMMRSSLARFIIDQQAVGAFLAASHRTPQWAQDRFPDVDPNLGLQSRRARDDPDPSVDPHKPHE